MTYGKAQSYSDYYKNKDQTPNGKPTDEDEPDNKSVPGNPRQRLKGIAPQRRAALARRLKMKQKKVM